MPAWIHVEFPCIRCIGFSGVDASASVQFETVGRQDHGAMPDGGHSGAEASVA